MNRLTFGSPGAKRIRITLPSDSGNDFRVRSYALGVKREPNIAITVKTSGRYELIPGHFDLLDCVPTESNSN